jgi:hypothetical protein
MMPLYRHTFPLPDENFPIPTRSSLIANACIEAGAITKAPNAMVYLTAISSVSASLQGLINVELPSGGVRPVSMWGMTIAESGERKSTVDNVFSKGIESFFSESAKKHKRMLRKYELELELHEHEASNIKKRLIK